jgi:hypothetical protein
MLWTQDMKNQLRHMWSKGRPLPEIRTALNVSKDALVSQAARMSLSAGHRAKATSAWSKVETDTLIAAHNEGGTPRDIHAHILPGRSAKAIHTKLTSMGFRPHFEKKVVPEEFHHEKPVAPVEDKLLPALIAYGLRHDCDLGMGRQAFMDRASELGMML